MNHFFHPCLSSCLLAIAAATVNAAPTAQPEQSHLGSVKVGSTATINVKISFPAAATLGSILVQPGGAAANQEFSPASGSTCTPGKAYSEHDSCSVAVAFKPLYAGKRYGSIQLLDQSGNLIAMDWLRGNGLAPQVSFMPGKTIALDSFPEVKGIAVDGNNSVYLALGSYATTPGEGVQGGEAYLTENKDGSYAYQGQSTWADPTGIWSDLAGNTYLYDFLLGFWESGSSSGPILGALQPTAVTGDPFGNLYLIQAGSNTLLKETLQPNPFPQNSTYVQTTLDAANSYGFQSPYGIWMDMSGNLYIQDVGYLYKWTLQTDGSFTQTYSTDLVGKVAVDEGGNLYGYGQSDHHWDKETLQANGSYVRTTLSTSIDNPSSLAADGIGNIYYAQANTSAIYQAVTKEDFTQGPTLSYANTPKGAISAADKVTISNSGTAPLSFSSVKFPADFPESKSAKGECTASTTLQTGQSCTLTANFAPNASLPTDSKSVPVSESILIATNTLNSAATRQAILVTGSEVPAAPTTTSISAGPKDDVMAGQKINLTMVVKPLSGNAIPTGNVTLGSPDTIRQLPCPLTRPARQ